LLWKFFATEFPNDRAQFKVCSKAHAMVNCPHALLGVEQTMPTFAVGVIGNDVKCAHGA
jgi:hypothetical protein